MRYVLSVMLAFVLAACDGRLSTVEVLDGDTLRLDGRLLQLDGVQAPDMNSLAACEQEMVLGAAAQRHLYDYVKAGVTLEPTGVRAEPNAYFVRLYTQDGKSVSRLMLDLGLVAEWRGAEHDWCGATHHPSP